MAQETMQGKEFVQKLSMLQGVLTFLLMGVSCVVLMVYLMFSSLWLLPVLYTVWMLKDWNTPERGGRRVEWLRNWTVWKHFRDYFPVKLVKTADLSPSKNYIMGPSRECVLSSPSWLGCSKCPCTGITSWP
ncbi:hypothetical protein SKAU_G00321250 [Synaphobranchus kaupii]|uniref:diacylglycerol O-acyltransferase n=1 Tax=Synaphobranchus kaupii TaxID=118154 RepID=A0A9Q1IJK5_SYNKA|nr:hypothetical protein SKAU_G00321250 [Synaphobranchus kaupii]